jgi:hypothetical protein
MSYPGRDEADRFTQFEATRSSTETVDGDKSDGLRFSTSFCMICAFHMSDWCFAGLPNWVLILQLFCGVFFPRRIGPTLAKEFSCHKCLPRLSSLPDSFHQRTSLMDLRHPKPLDTLYPV